MFYYGGFKPSWRQPSLWSQMRSGRRNYFAARYESRSYYHSFFLIAKEHAIPSAATMVFIHFAKALSLGILAVAAAITTSSLEAVAADRYWNSAAGGMFSAPSNWQGGMAPDSVDTAIFNLPGNYTVGFTSGRINDRLLVRDGEVTLGLGQWIYQLTNPDLAGLADLSGGSIIVGTLDGEDAALTISSGILQGLHAAIARSNLSKGAVTVTGENSEWHNSGTLEVGRNGQGELMIASGGSVSNANGSIGSYGDLQGHRAQGTVTVIGAGSNWHSSNFLYVGSNGRGVLSIEAGGNVSALYGRIGAGSLAQGEVTVVGGGSQWINSADLTVGGMGTGLLIVKDGGSVSNRLATISGGITAQGTVRVVGENSTWINSDRLDVGAFGLGELTIENGGDVTSTRGRIGCTSQSLGKVTVTGEGSSWTNTGSLYNSGTIYVGDSGSGELSIFDGGSVSNTGGFVGRENGSQGIAIVSGAASTWNNSEWLYVGHSGKGDMTIASRGIVSSAGGSIGSIADSRGTVLVAGAGSAWLNSRGLVVGVYGIGDLAIEEGGAVSNGRGEIGSYPGSRGTVTITGPGSAWTNSESLSIGRYGFGDLAISNAGQVFSRSSLIGEYSGSHGRVTIAGEDSTLIVSEELYVGYAGSGALTIENGGTVNTRSIYASRSSLAGDGAIFTKGAVLDDVNLIFNHTYGARQIIAFGDRGELHLDLDGTGDLGVGHRSTGSITIAEGRSITSARAVLGAYDGSRGTAIVTGAGSRWTNDSFRIGDISGSAIKRGGEVTISDGGSMVTHGAGLIIPGYDSDARVHVTGVGSNWSVGYFYMESRNDNVNAEMIIEEGGVVTSTYADIVSFHGNTNNVPVVKVSGEGSTWNSGDVYVFNGKLIVENGGRVVVPQELYVYGSLGELSGNGGTVAGNVVNLGTVAPGNSIGVLTIDGDYQQLGQSGMLHIELAGPTPNTEYDRLIVSGAVTLGGTLAIELIDNFAPSAGQSFDILDWGSVTGAFSDFDLPALPSALVWDLSALYTDGVIGVIDYLTGDFNNDGEVNGRDFLWWQRGVSPNPFSAGDLANWRANYGRLWQSSLKAPSLAVPEPDAAILIAYCGSLGVLLRRKRRGAAMELYGRPEPTTCTLGLEPDYGSRRKSGRGSRSGTKTIVGDAVRMTKSSSVTRRVWQRKRDDRCTRLRWR